MDLTHRFVVPAALDETWAAFNDLEAIAPCFPGATVDSVEGDEFSGSVKVKLGPIAMMYKGSGTFVERDEEQHRAVISAKGKDKRGNGTASVNVVAQLTAEGDGTAVEVTSDLSITGKPAQFGRGVIQDVSDKLLGQFVDCIAGELGPGDAEEPAPSEPTPSEPTPSEPTPAQSAATEPSPPPPPSQPRSSRPEADGAELNLMSTVLPVLLKRYGPLVGGVAVVAVIIWLVVRD